MQKELFVVLAAFIATVSILAASAQSVPYDVNAGRTPDIPLLGNFGDANEYFVREGMDGGKVSWEWNKATNKVEMRVFFSGLPTGRICYDQNPSNAYNQWPDCVRNGKWRFTIVHHTGTFPVKYYYDANNVLVGNEYDYYGRGNLPTMNLTEVQGVGTVMIMSDVARVRNGVIDQVFKFRYDSFLNYLGTTGIVDGAVYTVLNDSSTRINMYSHHGSMAKPMPAFSFEDILNDINNNGGSLVVLPTYQPFPEPAYLRGRDNLIRGPIAMMTAGVSGLFGPRIYDTPTCWAALYGTPEQKANPHEGDVQIRNYFNPACLFLTPPAGMLQARSLASGSNTDNDQPRHWAQRLRDLH